jgi:hypothetical protein
MVNLSSGKNSTDIALAVDAIDLVIAERPDVVVLVSSDSDFAPLVIRLREKGCRVCGIGQQGKTGDETVAVYDEFADLQHQGTQPAAKRNAARRGKPEKQKEKEKAPAPRAPALPDEVLQILERLPELLHGARMELNQAAESLRAGKLLGKRASSTKLFQKYPALFALSPDRQPSKVQYIGPLPP